jgi:SAM-dependent methyltransferase
MAKERTPDREDKAGTEYWEANWAGGGSGTPRPFDPGDTSLDNHVNRRFAAFFDAVFAAYRPRSVLEIGCANSIWPIYFHRSHGAEVAGLDYSAAGCERSRKMLRKHGVPGTIHLADLFEPPQEMRGRFDMAVSFGVVEHFRDTRGCLEACLRYVKPGGLLFTSTPNMSGLLGIVQKWVDRSVYETHTPLSRADLRDAHRRLPADLICCRNFLSINLSAVNSGRFARNRFNPALRRLLSGVSKAIWLLENRGVPLARETNFLSPYLLALARKKRQAEL